MIAEIAGVVGAALAVGLGELARRAVLGRQFEQESLGWAQAKGIDCSG